MIGLVVGGVILAVFAGWRYAGTASTAVASADIIAQGRQIYADQCAACHGKTGKGRGMFPMLVGQYTVYLKRQVDLYLKGDRPHDEEGVVGVLNGLKEKDVQDVLAYLTSIQEPKE